MLPPESESLSKALEAARLYADTILLGPLSELSGILTDTIGHWRLRNQIRLLLKSRAWLEVNGVRPEGIIPDIFVPLVAEASQVEDETLSNMFASLLAAHLDPAQRENVHPSYARVLAQLSPLDARLLVLFRRLSFSSVEETGVRGGGSAVKELVHRTQLDADVAYHSCLNLGRLGLIRKVGFKDREEQIFRITEYGLAFHKACNHCNPEQAEGANCTPT